MSNSRHLATVKSDRDLTSTIANPALPVALDDGNFVSARVVRLIEIIREQWPVLEVKWIPRSMRSETDPAFLIVETHQGQEFPVFFVESEDKFDGSVLERLILGDSHKHDVNTEVEARNEAVKMLQKKVKEDEREERIDMVTHAIKSGKYDYTIPNPDGKPFKLDTHGAKILRGEVK